MIDDEQGVKRLIEDKHYNLEYLQQHVNSSITETMVQQLLFQYGKLHYDMADYGNAADYLYYYRLLIDNTYQDLSMLKRSYASLWGILASKILLADFDGALGDLSALRELLEGSHSSLLFDTAVEQLQHRSWLIHWSLFVFFNHGNGKNAIIDLFFQDKYLSAIQTQCPHILRYLAAAVIVNKKRRGMLKDLARIIEQEQATQVVDPVLRFVDCLHNAVDFEGAQAELVKCDQVLRNDFFLINCRQDFLDNARQYVFESYCRVHRTIDVELIATQLNMDKASAERWIVNLIRNARYAAKIDSKSNRIVMQDQFPNVYQQIVEKIEGATQRTSHLRSMLESKLLQKI